MTDKYRSELFSRIKKLNFTNALVIRQALGLFLLFCAFFAVGFFSGHLIKPGNDADGVVCEFFCTSFKDLGFSNSIKRMAAFSLPDFQMALIILLSGYTMAAFPVSVTCLSCMGAWNGYVFSNLFRLLICSGGLSGGGATFAYISFCKLCVLITMIFQAIRATDFSYRYSELYRRVSRPFTSPLSANYALNALSCAGVTVALNILFLIFQFISPSAYI